MKPYANAIPAESLFALQGHEDSRLGQIFGYLAGIVPSTANTELRRVSLMV